MSELNFFKNHVEIFFNQVHFFYKRGGSAEKYIYLAHSPRSKSNQYFAISQRKWITSQSVATEKWPVWSSRGITILGRKIRSLDLDFLNCEIAIPQKQKTPPYPQLEMFKYD